MALDPPAYLTDLDARGRQLWEAWLDNEFTQAKAGTPNANDGPRQQFFDPREAAALAPLDTASPSWSAFPNNIKSATASNRARWEAADRSRLVQDEYCEWSVTREPETSKILSVQFTCEGPDYWRILGRQRQSVVDLYREFVSPDVREEDLFDATGEYVSANRWNRDTTNGAMHLIQPSNNLHAEIELAAGASVVRTANGQVITDSDYLIAECSRYGDAGRNSDPLIGRSVNALARAGSRVSLQNPVGLYFDDLFVTDDWVAPDGANPKEFWRYEARGNDGFHVRAVYEVPAEAGYTVSDIRIGDDPIMFGSQIADAIKIKLTATATQPRPGLPDLVEGCKRSGPNQFVATSGPMQLRRPT